MTMLNKKLCVEGTTYAYGYDNYDGTMTIEVRKGLNVNTFIIASEPVDKDEDIDESRKRLEANGYSRLNHCPLALLTEYVKYRKATGDIYYVDCDGVLKFLAQNSSLGRWSERGAVIGEKNITK